MVGQSLKSSCENGLGLPNGGRWIHTTLSQAHKVTCSLPSCAKLHSAVQDEKGPSMHASTRRGYLPPRAQVKAVSSPHWQHRLLSAVHQKHRASCWLHLISPVTLSLSLMLLSCSSILEGHPHVPWCSLQSLSPCSVLSGRVSVTISLLSH